MSVKWGMLRKCESLKEEMKFKTSFEGSSRVSTLYDLNACVDRP